MSLLMSIFLGIVQGVAEFLPISSSGHLAIFENFFKLQNIEESHMLFDVLLHLGTLVAVIIVYRSDIKEMIVELVAFFREIGSREQREERPSSKRRQLLLLVVACLPLVVGFFIGDLIEMLRASNLAIGIALLITGLILFLADKYGNGKKTEKNASVWDALIVGLAQIFGTIPGISRSGITISAGLFSGFSREFAVRFSFLLSIPAVIGANVLTLVKAVGAGIDTSLIPVYLAGVVTAAVCGFFAIKLINYLVDKNKFGKFSYYCWAVGLIVIVASFFVK